MRMHENNKRNAMLSETNKKNYVKEIKITAGGMQ